MVTSHMRSMSQAFWGAEQAKDQESTKEKANQDSTLQEMLEKLDRLEQENARCARRASNFYFVML